jgi:hypothetical protein
VLRLFSGLALLRGLPGGRGAGLGAAEGKGGWAAA